MVKRLLLLTLVSSSLHAQFPKKMIIDAPVCDVRTHPEPGTTFDNLQETQLTYGDRVIAYKEHNGFLRIEALDQRNYPGWIRGDVAKTVAMFPTRAIKPKLGRKEFIAYAHNFLGQKYCWGGCSEPVPDSPIPTGVDCSGLIYLCARACGINLARNSGDQLKECKVITTLRPGDLIFSAPEQRPNKITHVMIYEGEGKIIEALEEATQKVCLSDPVQRFGKPIAQLNDGEPANGVVLYFRSFFKD